MCREIEKVCVEGKRDKERVCVERERDRERECLCVCREIKRVCTEGKRECVERILKNGQPNYKYFTEDDVKILKIIKK